MTLGEKVAHIYQAWRRYTGRPMTTLEALRVAVGEAPDDDAARLALADYAAENGLADVEREQRLAVALRRVLAAPDDDGPRLEYADVCERFGDANRAEFIRVQCELATRNPAPILPSNQEELDALRARERELWLRREAVAGGQYRCKAHSWLPAPPGLTSRVRLDDPSHIGWCVAEDLFETFRCEVRRGFVEAVTCSGDDWARHGDAVLAAHPVRRVTFTDAGPDVAEGGTDWRRMEVVYTVAGREVGVPERDAMAVGEDREVVRLALSARWPQIPPEGWTFAPRPLIAPEDFEYLGPLDDSYDAYRRFMRGEIARGLGVPPDLLGGT